LRFGLDADPGSPAGNLEGTAVEQADEATRQAERNPFLDPDDDMYDDPDQMPASPLLRRALVHWQAVAGPYWHANRRALEHQRRHRRTVTLTAIFGAVAVILAILQLAYGISPMMESIAAALAAMAVILGISAGFMEEWLVQRHRAERIRLLKYRSLLDLALIDPSEAGFPAWQHQVSQEMSHIERDSTERWSEEDKLSDEPSWAGKIKMDPDEMAALVAYYRTQRLEDQTDYFFRKARSNTRKDAQTRQVPPLLFGLSIVCALAHFALDWLAARGHIAPHEQASRTLIVLAAIFPVIGAAVRTYRSAHEFSRNTTRFWAKYLQLRMRAERLKVVTWPEDVLRELWQSESTLEQEHREWLRLMEEAEWFG
jgi:hypothetical protein